MAFTENFYGLERFSSSDNSPKIQIRHSWLGKSKSLSDVVCLNLDSSGVVVLPYLRQKVERIFLLVREEVADSQAGKYQRFKKIFVQLYPYLHLLLDSLDICKTFQYLYTLLRSTLRFPTEIQFV